MSIVPPFISFFYIETIYMTVYTYNSSGKLFSMDDTIKIGSPDQLALPTSCDTSDPM